MEFWLLFGVALVLVLGFFTVKFGLGSMLGTAVDPSQPLFFDTENMFVDPNRNNKRFAFPFLKDASQVDLSIVFPAYNEEERLEKTLIETIQFLKDRQVNHTSNYYYLINFSTK